MLEFFGSSSSSGCGAKRPQSRPRTTTSTTTTTTTTRRVPVVQTTTVKRRSAASVTPFSDRGTPNAKSLASHGTTTNALSKDVRARLVRDREARLSTPVSDATADRPRKRRRRPVEPSASPAETPSNSSSSSADSSSDDGGGTKSAPPPRRRQTTSVSSPVPSGYLRLGRTGVASEYSVPRDCIDVDSTSPPFSILSSRELVQKTGGDAFQPFFKDIASTHVATLEYPAQDATEEYLLVSPRSDDEYDPIAELLRVVYAIVASYVDPDVAIRTFGLLEDLETGPTSTAPLPRKSMSTPTTPHTGLTPSNSPPVQESITRSFTKARNRRDGRLFLQTLDRFNGALRPLKESGQLTTHMRTKFVAHGIPEAVWSVIQAQCYARAVGPHVEGLADYAAFSDNVYGELLPVFMSEIAQLTHLGPGKRFLDLGSGVGNLLVQAAIQTGARAEGVEVMQNPAKCAETQLVEAKNRCRMWGLKPGSMHAWRADFCEDSRVRHALTHADVVLVNNYAFSPSTNETLSLQFLDLKDGARIVSLRPFVPPDFKLSERTLSSPLAILRVEEREHSRDAVSWAERPGKYYIQTVDRSLLRNVASALDSSPTRRRHRPKYRRVVDDDDEEEGE